MNKNIFIILLLSNIACAQISEGFWGSAIRVDTTTNYYVYSDLHLDQVLADSVNAPTDSIFVMVNLDSLHTINVSCFIGAYDLSSKPIIFGADTLTGFTEVTGTSGDAIVDTFYSSANMDDVLRQYSTGIYDFNYMNLGAQVNSDDRNGWRFNNIIERAIHDSTKIEFVAYASPGSNTLKIKFLCEDADNPSIFSTYSDFDTRYADSTTNNVYYTSTANWADGTRYSFRIDDPIDTLFSKYTYSGSQSLVVFEGDAGTVAGVMRAISSYNYNSQTEKPALIVYSHSESAPSYYKKYITDYVYNVYFGDARGLLVENKDSVNGAGDWYYDDANDSLFVYSTSSGVIATLRNGFNTTASNTIAGIDFQKCNKGIYASEGASITVKQSNFYENIYGVLDTADGVSTYLHNKINNNLNNAYFKNKDTLHFYNNTVFSYLPDYTGETNFTSLLSLLHIKNNAFWIDNAGSLKIGTIDLGASILSMDNNAYGYDHSSLIANKFWQIAATEYDSLAQFVTATGLDVNSFDIKGWHSTPTNSSSYVWNDNGSDNSGFYFGNNETVFYPRKDTTVISPLVLAGVYISNYKDFYGEDYLTIPNIGAVERIDVAGVPTFASVYMYNLSDSAKLNLDYDINVWDSMTVYANDQYIEKVGVVSSHYVNPIRNTTFDNPEINILSAVVADTSTSTASIIFYVRPNNDSTTYRIRYGISSFTDSTAGAIAFIYEPEATTYKLLFTDATYGEQWSVEQVLTYADSMSVSVLLSGLAADTTYTADVTVLNDSGWANSSDVTFRIESPTVIVANYYISPDSTYKTIAQVNALSLDSGDVVAFEGGEIFSDAVLNPQRGVTYKSFGTGLAIIGDSTINVSPNTYNTTVLVSNPHVVLDSLKIYGYLDGNKVINYADDSLTITYCEIIGGGNSHTLASRGINHETTASGITDVNIQHNKIHGFGQAGILLRQPYNFDISYNEIYDLWRTSSYPNFGAVAIGQDYLYNNNSPTDVWDCNYTVNIHHNEIHHFDYMGGFASYSRIIFEYNEIHSNLDERIYHGGAKHGALGKMWDTDNGFKFSLGAVIRYNYVHDLYFRGEDGYDYGYPSDAQRLAGTPNVLSSSNGLGYPRYFNSSGVVEMAEPPEPLITGSGYGIFFVHNNIFHNCSKAIINKGSNNVDVTLGSDSTKRAYFYNNTIINCGIGRYPTQSYIGLVRQDGKSDSPMYEANNIFHTSNTLIGAVNGQSNKYVALEKNIYINPITGTLSDGSLPPEGGKYATAMFWRGTSTNTYITDELYNETLTNIWDDTTATINVPNVGIAGVDIPDIRIKTTSNAYDNGKDYSTLGTALSFGSYYSYWTQSMTLGQDPTGRSFAYDITGTLRALNHIGALKAVGE